LTAKLFEHLGSTSEPVTRFANGDVEDELLDAQLPHGVLALVFSGFRHFGRGLSMSDGYSFSIVVNSRNKFKGDLVGAHFRTSLFWLRGLA